MFCNILGISLQKDILLQTGYSKGLPPNLSSSQDRGQPTICVFWASRPPFREGFYFAIAYLDDILVASSSTDEHTSEVTQLVEWLNDSGIIVNPEKCVIGVSQVDILGYVLNAQGTVSGKVQL